jgi:hypothetical protein
MIQPPLASYLTRTNSPAPFAWASFSKPLTGIPNHGLKKVVVNFKRSKAAKITQIIS